MERGNMMHGTVARENLKAYYRTTGNFPFGQTSSYIPLASIKEFVV